MQSAIVTFCFRRARSSSITLLSALAVALGCGGSEVEGGQGDDPAPSGGSASLPNPAPSQGSAGTNAGPSPSTNSPAPTGGAPASTPASSEGGTRPASVDAMGVGAACAALEADACGACVCRECSGPLDTCANTPGCPEILACVRDNGCSGTDCFCGDALLTRCFAGGGDGPCKAAVLAAPGGREPTLDDPSGGPASDAALAVGECADEDDRCADVCDVGL